MSHEPYLTWLLSDDPLPPENMKALNDHLQDCHECRILRDSWFDLENFIRSVPALEPEPGFVYRWHDYHALDQIEEQVFRHRWQSLITLILTLNVLAFLSIGLFLGLASIFDSPAQIILQWASRLTSFVSFVNTAQELALTVLMTFTQVIPNELWLAFAAFISVVGIIWIFVIQKYSLFQRRART
ncbi:MAG: hypothetical protein PVG14_01465 [Anaerolineales bacterium]|jgi:hypothetical protein